MQRQLPAVAGSSKKRFRHHRKPAPHPGESAVLRETAKFDRAFERPWNFVDRMRDGRIADVGFVSRVEEDDRFVFPRVIDPARQLFAGCDRTGRVVWETK